VSEHDRDDWATLCESLGIPPPSYATAGPYSLIGYDPRFDNGIRHDEGEG